MIDGEVNSSEAVRSRQTQSDEDYLQLSFREMIWRRAAFRVNEPAVDTELLVAEVTAVEPYLRRTGLSISMLLFTK